MVPPVLVVGNLIAGGAGKTPVVLAVCKSMQAKGYQIGILTRGYRRQGREQLLLKPGQRVDASECGDEPAWLLQQANCPIAVGAQRESARQALVEAYPSIDLIVSDDGLQHHHLGRSLEWVIFDDRAAGNGRLLPAGPLREPLTRLKTVDSIISTGLPPEQLAERLNWPDSSQIEHLHVQLTGFENLTTSETLDVHSALERFTGQDILAFTGLGNPNKFFKALRAAGLQLDETLALPDHFDYPDHFCSNLNCTVALTTGKDAVKLKASSDKVWVVQFELRLPDHLITQIEDKIGRASR